MKNRENVIALALIFSMLITAELSAKPKDKAKKSNQDSQRVEFEMIAVPGQVCYMPSNGLGYGSRSGGVRHIQNSDREKYEHTDYVVIEGFSIAKNPLAQSEIERIVAWAESSERGEKRYDFADEIELLTASDKVRKERSKKLLHPYLLCNALSEMQGREPVYWIYERNYDFLSGNESFSFHPLRNLKTVMRENPYYYDFSELSRIETNSGYRCPNDMEFSIFMQSQSKNLNEREKNSYLFASQDYVEKKEAAGAGNLFPVLPLDEGAK